jgi:uncharacterized protein
MPLKLNIRHLERRDLTLKGELPVSELDLEALDELIHVQEPLRYALEVQKIEHAVLVSGSLRLKIVSDCARCLKPHPREIVIEDWTCHLPLVADDEVEKAEVINDCIDLVPYVREDIVLAFPQHPLCDPECKGLKSPLNGLSIGELDETERSSTWSELNKLKF